jgi:uncharacterized protein with von Willebrand factor type A (vWA) domain
VFIDFYYQLKAQKVPVSVQEYMLFIRALDEGLIHDLDTLYHVGRSILVKDIGYYDKYDQVFANCFKDIPMPPALRDEILEWLKRGMPMPKIPDYIQKMLNNMSLDELERLFEQRLREQTEQHDGGNKWIGTGGDSPFGHGGNKAQAGVRVGGESMYRSAVKVAMKRRFQNYRNDIVLDIRSIGIALKKLRILARIGEQEELDLDETVDKTCKNAGEIDLVYRKKRKNNVKVLLMMDSGGSMEPFAGLVSRLFSAAHQASHFKDFKYYYFHNCPYQDVYSNIYMEKKVATNWILTNLDKDYRLIMVGDAAMAPWELSERDGAIYFYDHNETPGLVWLRRLRERFPHSIWLNPDFNPYYGAITRNLIKDIFPMFFLSLEGLELGIQELVGRTHVDPKQQMKVKATFAL